MRSREMNMLETERLLLRKFTPEDINELIELRSDDEVIKYLGGRQLQNPEAIAGRMQFYMDCYDKFGFGMSAMIWKETNEMIGWSGLQPLDDTTEIEVGYGMIKEFWGRVSASSAPRRGSPMGLKKRTWRESSPSLHQKTQVRGGLWKNAECGMKKPKRITEWNAFFMRFQKVI